MNYNIPQLLQSAFGFLPRYFIPEDQTPSGLPDYSVTSFGYSSEYPRTALGTPWIQQVELLPVTDPVTQQAWPGLILPETTMVILSRKKHLVATRVAGRDGSVIEQVALDDWDISLKGLLINKESLDPPYELVGQLHDAFEVHSSIPVSCDLFAAVGIDQVVLETLRIEDIQGTAHAKAFDIKAMAEVPFELQRKEGL